MTTLADIIQRVQEQLSMVAGASVQTYAEDIIGEYIQIAFDQLFLEYDWPQFRGYTTTSLDSTTGIHGADLTNLCKDYLHLQHVYFNEEPTPLAELPMHSNPAMLANDGSTIYYEPINNAAKLFRVIPVDTTGDVTITYKTKPANFGGASTVNFDSALLTLKAAFMYAEADGTNSQHSMMLGRLYGEHLATVRKQLFDKPFAIGQRSNTIPTQWYSY